MNTFNVSRRALIKTGVQAAGATAGMAMAATSGFGYSQAQATKDDAPAVRKGNVKQSVCKWCYPKSSVDELCAYGAKIGLKGVDLLQPEEWEIPRKYGIICTMAYGGGGTIADALNRVENHAAIEAAFRKNIPLAAKSGVPNIITFSGNRKGMSDEEGAKNCVIGLNRIKKIGEDNGVTIVMELLNSKVNHKDYMCDHTAWGVGVVEQVNSPNVKLLYDIYHMQIMEGDLIHTVTDNAKWMGHFHTGGVPGRHELNDQQEVQWDGVMRGIVATGYKGYVAHEFIPTGDPFTSLRQAVDLCDV